METTLILLKDSDSITSKPLTQHKIYFDKFFAIKNKIIGVWFTIMKFITPNGKNTVTPPPPCIETYYTSSHHLTERLTIYISQKICSNEYHFSCIAELCRNIQCYTREYIILYVNIKYHITKATFKHNFNK